MKEEIVVALEKGPGTQQKSLKRTREGIKIDVAMKVYAQVVGQYIRANRAVTPDLADEAFKCANQFLDALDRA